MKKIYFLFFFIIINVFFSQNKIIIDDYSKEIVINNYSIITNQDGLKIDDFQSKNSLIKNKKVLYKFFVFNNSKSDSIYYINTQEDVSEFVLYEKINGKYIKLGSSGFSCFKDKLSVEKDTYNIKFKILPNKEKKLLIEVDKYEYKLQFPELRIIKRDEFLESIYSKSKSIYTVISNIFIGIHFSLFLIGLYKIRSKKYRKPLIYFVILNLMYVIYILFINEEIILENHLFPKIPNITYEKLIGCLEPALYYMFFRSYLTFKKKYKFFETFLKFSGLYWLVYFITRISNFENYYLIKFSDFIKDFATIYDLIVTIFVFVYLLKFKSIFYKFARIGVFLLLLSAIQMSLPYILGLLGFGETPFIISEFSYLFMGIMIIVDFLLFLYGINLDEINSEKEKQYFKTQLLQKEIERQKEIEKERERISSDVHDDLGARISALKLQGEFIKENYSENPQLKSELDELMKTTEEMTVAMREMIWSLKTQNDFLQNFISFSQKYASEFFLKSKIKIHFKNEVKENLHLNAEVRRNLFLCYKEALNNIYKHSIATDVYITFSLENNLLKLEISDNGIGINKEKTKQGNGLYNMQTRMQEISGNLKIPETEKGTLLLFTSPLEI